MLKNIPSNIKLICQYLGGSHLYGLNTPTSDQDVRYVFLNTELGQIIGIDRFEHLDRRNKDEDSFGMELRGFFSLLRKTNTQVLELLFAKESAFTLLDLEFKRLVLQQHTRFIDSDKFFKSLCGYIYTERRLALGERAGQIGGKRYAQVEKYGYSPKNMVQLFRLAHCGIEFFRSGYFPTNIKEYSNDLWKYLIEIKTQPENFNPQTLVEETYKLKAILGATYDTSSIKFKFDVEYANWVILALYKDLLKNHLLELNPD